METQKGASDGRKPKGPIKFQISLNEEQKEAKRLMIENTITILRGTAGSGKSMAAAQCALDLLFRKEIEKIVITRPTVTSGEDVGFLPGGIDDKLAPFTAPVYDSMHRIYNKEKVDKCLQDGLIEVIPLAFMRGRNLSNCCVIVDEAQNITHRQMELLLSRLCNGSKMIICGDVAQIDLKDKRTSGFDFVCKNFKDIAGFCVFTLKHNHRHPIVSDILEVYKNYHD